MYVVSTAPWSHLHYHTRLLDPLVSQTELPFAQTLLHRPRGEALDTRQPNARAPVCLGADVPAVIARVVLQQAVTVPALVIDRLPAHLLHGPIPGTVYMSSNRPHGTRYAEIDCHITTPMNT